MPKNDLIEEYRSLKERYGNFSHRVKYITENLLSKEGFIYQVVTCRAKDEASLKGKLQTLKGIKSVEEIDDLAGCRIILYLENDIKKVIKHLYDEFEVVEPKPKYSEDGYNAMHFVVKMKEDRLELCEYESFKGLKCEIQLTTVLHHAWSELAHDIIYKVEKSLSEFDQPSFDALRERFSSLMQDYIKKAQYSFDFIFSTIENIKEGKKGFDVNFLRSIIDSSSNNEIYGRLSFLLACFREFGDKTPEGLKMIEIVNEALEKSKKLKKETIKTPNGDLPGHGYEDIAKICLDILDRLKFFCPQEVFESLKLLSIDENEEVKEKALKVAEEFAKFIFLSEEKEKRFIHDLQIVILDEIEKLDDRDLLTYLNLLVAVSNGLFSLSRPDTSWKNYKVVIFQDVMLPATDTVKKIRERTINVLKKLYSVSGTISEKQKILKALELVTELEPPFNFHAPEIKKEIKKMVLENANDLVSYYSSFVEKEVDEIKIIINDQLDRLLRKFPKGLKNVNELRTSLEDDEGYGIYKVLVVWDHLDYDGSEKRRAIDEYVKQINDSSFPRWRTRIVSAAKSYEHFEYREFCGLRVLLNELGRQKPGIARELIPENEEELKPFLSSLVIGISRSKEKGGAHEILENWIEKGKYLSDCANILGCFEKNDVPLLEKIYQKAVENDDVNALKKIILFIARNFEQSKIGKDLFVKTVKRLTKHESSLPLAEFCKHSILLELDENDWKVVLENMLFISEIEFFSEEVLAAFVKSSSSKDLAGFFHQRMKISKEKEQKEFYEAIPYGLGNNEFRELINQDPKDLIEEILKICEKEKDWSWHCGKLLVTLFPNFHLELEDQLIKLITGSKDENKVKIVLDILLRYEGQPFLHGVCKELINQNPRNEKLRNKLFVVLSEKKLVCGEDGFVKCYESKKQEIQGWKKDGSEYVQKFALKYEQYLSRRIVEEKKEAERKIETMKMEHDFRR